MKSGLLNSLTISQIRLIERMLRLLTIPQTWLECGYARLIGYNGVLSQKRAYSINRLYSRLNLKTKQGILPDKLNYQLGNVSN